MSQNKYLEKIAELNLHPGYIGARGSDDLGGTLGGGAGAVLVGDAVNRLPIHNHLVKTLATLGAAGLGYHYAGRGYTLAKDRLLNRDTDLEDSNFLESERARRAQV